MVHRSPRGAEKDRSVQLQASPFSLAAIGQSGSLENLIRGEAKTTRAEGLPEEGRIRDLMDSRIILADCGAQKGISTNASNLNVDAGI